MLDLSMGWLLEGLAALAIQGQLQLGDQVTRLISR
jgi:hypothetical protein